MAAARSGEAALQLLGALVQRALAALGGEQDILQDRYRGRLAHLCLHSLPRHCRVPSLLLESQLSLQGEPCCCSWSTFCRVPSQPSQPPSPLPRFESSPGEPTVAAGRALLLLHMVHVLPGAFTAFTASLAIAAFRVFSWRANCRCRESPAAAYGPRSAGCLHSLHSLPRHCRVSSLLLESQLSLQGEPCCCIWSTFCRAPSQPPSPLPRFESSPGEPTVAAGRALLLQLVHVLPGAFTAFTASLAIAAFRVFSWRASCRCRESPAAAAYGPRSAGCLHSLHSLPRHCRVSSLLLESQLSLQGEPCCCSWSTFCRAPSQPSQPPSPLPRFESSPGEPAVAAGRALLLQLVHVLPGAFTAFTASLAIAAFRVFSWRANCRCRESPCCCIWSTFCRVTSRAPCSVERSAALSRSASASCRSRATRAESRFTACCPTLCVCVGW